MRDMNYKENADKIYQEIWSLHQWLKLHDYNYYSVNSLPDLKWMDSLCVRWKSLGVLYRQFFRLSPINLRPLFLPITPSRNPKATILLARAYLNLWKLTGVEEFKDAFETLIERTITLRSDETRNIAIRQNKKIIVWLYQAGEKQVSPLLTAWTGELFMDAWKLFGTEEYSNIAGEIAAYFIKEHPRAEDNNTIYFFYDSNHSFRVYNASAVISSFVIRYGSIFDHPEMLRIGKKGLSYIQKVQNRDGSWFYGEERICRYVDNFHTGFVLKAIWDAISYLNVSDYVDCFNKGITFYKKSLFIDHKNGELQPLRYLRSHPPYNSSLIQKVDLRDVTSAMILFSGMAIKSSEYSKLVTSVFRWVQKNMKSKSTYHNEITWFWKNRIPYIEFQAWMLLALTYHYKQQLFEVQ